MSDFNPRHGDYRILFGDPVPWLVLMCVFVVPLTVAAAETRGVAAAVQTFAGGAVSAHTAVLLVTWLTPEEVSGE